MAKKKSEDTIAHAEYDSGLKPVVTRKQMQVILGVNDRTLRDLIATGICVLADDPNRKLVRAPETLGNYIKNLREKAAGRATSTGETLADVRAKKEEVERQISEMKLANLRGEMMPVADVTAAWAAFAVSVRAKFLSLPGKFRAQMSHLTAHDEQAMKKIVRSDLEDLADEVTATVIGGRAEVLTRGK
jgi:phage terminase Nu1 subunit (DNA packaging protein)